MTKNIAIVCGGNTGEYDISISSAGVVSKNLDRKKYNGYLIIIEGSDWYFEKKGIKYPVDKNDFSLKMDGEKVIFDGVFNAIHGTPGEDGKLQGYFDMIGIPYTSSNHATSALTFNKHFCNRFVNSYGIKSANSLSFTRKDKIDKEEVIKSLGLPLFIKPGESGSSVGISKVNVEAEFDEAVKIAFGEGERILIEEFIKGREIACGLVNKGNELIVFPLTEIVSKKDFFDYEAKYTDGLAEEITPAEVSEEVEQDIKTLSSFLFREMDCKGFVRFDYILAEDDLYFLEVNTVPGISEASIMPKMAGAFGMSIGDFFNIVLANLFA
jgi:D-alanine-D-alanine ligase